MCLTCDRSDHVKMSNLLSICFCVFASASDAVIDSRYLQRADEIPLRGASPPPQTSLHFSGPLPTAPSAAQPTRLSKDAILAQRPVASHSHTNAVNTSSTAAPKSITVAGHLSNLGIVGNKQSQPPLASAYFPTQNKVT